MKNLKKAIAVLLCMIMLIPFSAAIGSAAIFESKPIESSATSNIIDRNVSRWAYPRSSYIYSDGDNIVVIRVTDKVTATSYNMNYQEQSEKTVDFELPLFGGFYSGKTFNYIVFGQNNSEESTSKEVYRIVKYDKNFNKISHASIVGSQCETVTPFYAGSLSMAEYGNELTVHTSRKLFKSDDGLNHQSQFTVVLDTATMSPVNSLQRSQYNHVSHSFNQFVAYDNGKRVLVDHGDAYPRSVVLSKYTGTNDSGEENYTKTNLFDIPGTVGANCTGVNLGSFEVSDNNYIVSINTIDHSKATGYNNYTIDGLEVDIRDAVLLISAKNNQSTDSVKEVYLTDYTDNNLHATAPYLVKITDKWFAVLWKEIKAVEKQSGDYKYFEFQDNGIKYVIVDEYGYKLSDIKTASVTAELSDCQPILVDNKIIWHYDDSSERYICSLDISDELEAISHVHTLSKIEAKTSTCTVEGNNEYYKCTICGKYFKDAEGTTQTTAADETLPVIAHTGGTATCTAKATCSECGTSYGSTLPHTPGEWIETAQPDCSNVGFKSRKCTVCDFVVETGTIPAKGHVPGDWETVKEPTVTEYGKKIRTCTVCRQVAEEQRIPKIGTLSVTDKSTGIKITYPENAYSGTVGISVQSVSGTELDSVINTHIGNSKYKAYDIGITVDGIQAEPNGAFTVSIPFPGELNKNYTILYKLNPLTGIPEKVTYTIDNGNYIVENGTPGCFVVIEKNATLTLSSYEFNLKAGESVQLLVTSDRNYTFTSSNPSVAYVDNFGNITASSGGTAIITVTVDGTDVSETCTVTVTQNIFEIIISAIINAFSKLIEFISDLINGTNI